MVTNVLFALLAIFCFAGMMEYRKRADKAESYGRNAHKLYRQSQAVIDSLNTKIAEQNDRITMLQSIYHSTYATMKDSYKSIQDSYKTLKSSSNSNGGNKDNGNNHKTQPVQSASTPAANKTATLSDLGTITPREQKMLDKWISDKTPEFECVKRINNIRNSEAKRVKA